MAFRIDRGELRPPTKTAAGFLKADCLATRTGIFVYRDAAGKVRREYRPPAEVFNPASMETLQGVPVTNEHPPELLTAENAGQFTKGFTGDQVEKIDNFVGVNVTITDADLIEQAEAESKVEVSLGYTCDTDETAGEINGEQFDAIQKNIRYNHLAIVSRGRAGSAVRLRMDDLLFSIEGENVTTKKIRIDEMEIELPEAEGNAVEEKLAALAAVVADLEAKVSALTGEAEQAKADKCAAEEKAKGDVEAATAEADKAKGEAEAAKSEVAKMDSMIHTATMERVGLIDVAKKHLENTDFAKLSNQEIKRAVASKVFPEVKLDNANPEFVDGVFVAVSQVGNSAVKSLADAVSGARNDSADDSAEAARKRSMEASKNAWKN